MTTVGDVTINVIFPIQQKLYDAVMEQVHSTGASLDSLYCDACAGCFAELPGVEQGGTHILRSFQLEELGNRATMGGLMQATLVLSPDLYTAVQAIALAQKKPVEAICEGVCIGALQTQTGASNTMR